MYYFIVSRRRSPPISRGTHEPAYAQHSGIPLTPGGTGKANSVVTKLFRFSVRPRSAGKTAILESKSLGVTVNPRYSGEHKLVNVVCG